MSTYLERESLKISVKDLEKRSSRLSEWVLIPLKTHAQRKRKRPLEVRGKD